MTQTKTNQFYETRSGRIIEKRLFALIAERNGVLPIISVRKPSAPSPKPCMGMFNGIDHLFDIATGLLSDSMLSMPVRAVIEIQLLSGCRISEVLGIESRNISKNGTIKIIGSKGSNDRFVIPTLFRSYWLRCRENGYTPGHLHSRFYFHRLYKQKGLYTAQGNSPFLSVTHCFRKLHGSDVYDINKSIDDVRKMLGHKSKRSSEFYINSNEKNS